MNLAEYVIDPLHSFSLTTIRYIYLQSLQMVHRKKSTPLQESEGEEFSDNSECSKASSIDNPAEDGWVFPIVLPGAKRTEYESVCQTKLFDLDIVELTTVSRHSKRPNSK
jgi:hypothetical protein